MDTAKHDDIDIERLRDAFKGPEREPQIRKRQWRKGRQVLKKINGVTVLDNEAGNRFYHKHKSPKAVARKKKARKTRKQSRRR